LLHELEAALLAMPAADGADGDDTGE